MIRLGIVVASLLQGFLSMGFQLVATRIVAPYFGSSLIVWALIISTFLAGFSLGALTGGACSRLPPRRVRHCLNALAGLGLAGFGVAAALGQPILAAIDAGVGSFVASLALACVALFFLPVFALSSVLPIFTEALAGFGSRSGLSAGIVYSISTVGNILGVICTAFFLIPAFHTSSILVGWAMAAAVCFALFVAVVHAALAARA